MDPGVERVLTDYPRIFFACHLRHRRDPKTRRLLSAHQGSILDHLDDVEATSLMDLARHMGVTPSTMSISIERLVRRGYVVRTRDARDKRRLKLLLSPAGRRVKEAQSVLEPARVAGMLAQLPPADKEAALRGLALLARAAQQFMASGPPKRMLGIRRRRRLILPEEVL